MREVTVKTVVSAHRPVIACLGGPSRQDIRMTVECIVFPAQCFENT